LARSTTATAAAHGICSTGTANPKKTPIAAPAATRRRLSCHSHGRRSSGPSQASERFARSASAEGSQRASFLRMIALRA
jgi:hypothetical protein